MTERIRHDTIPVRATLGDKTIAHFLSELAAGTPEPGGGAAAGLMAAASAALLSMACGLTVRNGRDTSEESGIFQAMKEAQSLQARALDLASSDIETLRQITAASRLPRRTQAERADRAARIQESLTVATDVPLRLAELAARVLELSAGVIDATHAPAQSDLAVGAIMAGAAMDGAALTVRTNLRLIQDDEFHASAKVRLETVCTDAARLRRQLQDRA